ncbi:hypothetical protein V1283_003140 [Bradyrhizobium sp. AZCC 2262]|uniref:hypothetical protein n=1 Tax=Bradyrhizobium sp. AZCC 2262 TaxID=3117022 RepID=UPI002FF3AA85
MTGCAEFIIGPAKGRTRMQARGSSGVSLIELYEQQVAETRRMNVFLERIAASLEKREGSAGS